jgi:hypothetical protein
VRVWGRKRKYVGVQLFALMMESDLQFGRFLGHEWIIRVAFV